MIKLIHRAAKFQDKCVVFWGIKIWRELNYTEVTRLNHFWGSFNFSFFPKHFHVRLDACYNHLNNSYSCNIHLQGSKAPFCYSKLVQHGNIYQELQCSPQKPFEA